MTRKDIARGLDHLCWLTRPQGERLLQCRAAGHECAQRFQKNGQGKETDVPFLCGFISTGERCKNDKSVHVIAAS